MTRLVGVLTRFTRDESGWSPGMEESLNDDEYSIVLNETLSVETKSLVSEVQVHILLRMTHQGQYTTARKLCRQTLETYTGLNCPLRRIRVVERLLYLAVINGDTRDDILDLGRGAITILTSPKVHTHSMNLTQGFDKDEGLAFSRKALLARCLVWMALLSDNTDNPKGEYFPQALAIWTRWSDKIMRDPKEQDKDEIVEVAEILGICLQVDRLQ